MKKINFRFPDDQSQAKYILPNVLLWTLQLHS